MHAHDRRGYTALMHSLESPAASADLVRLLLGHEDGLYPAGRRPYESDAATLASLALGAGDPEKVTQLIEHGVDFHYSKAEGYDALLDAVHGRDVGRDPRLLDLLRILVAQGVELNGVSAYGESGLRVLSYLGRFDAVRLLLDAGGDATQLQWTPLLRSVALGTVDDVRREIGAGAALESSDWWARTPWLLAIQAGDLAKARLLRERGANLSARGRCGKPALFYAIESHHTAMLGWLLETGISISDTDEFGTTPLMYAADNDNEAALALLLQAGADVQYDKDGQTALSHARTRAVAALLLDAGANPADLPFTARRGFLGLPADPDETLLTATVADFASGSARRFGKSNPAPLNEPFCDGMVRAGINAYQAIQLFKGADARSPVWCAERFGQSITFLPDGRVVQIAGEHEDHYDADFCIYNDVFVHEPDGTIRIFGYPEAVFPPTDFHTATLVGRHIYIIGSLGYPGSREIGKTPLYRLDTRAWRIEALDAGGIGPGRIYGHRAKALASGAIRVCGGTIITSRDNAVSGGREDHVPNNRCFDLDVGQLVWSEVFGSGD